MTPLRALILALAFLVLPGAAVAGEIVRTENVEAELVAEAVTVAPGATVTVALRQKIRDRWHTYWENPGDSGEPTRIDWTLPEGWSAGPLQFPWPKRVPVGPLVNFGYEGEVWFLTTLTVPASAVPGSSVTLAGDATWLVCEEICIPEEAALTLTLPVGTETVPDPAAADAFAAARAKLPRPAPPGVTWAVDDDTLSLFVPLPGLSAARLEGAAFFPAADAIAGASSPQAVAVAAEGLVLSVKAGRAFKDGASPAVTGLLTITERADGGAITQALTIDAAKGTVPAAAAAPQAAGFFDGLTAPEGTAAIGIGTAIVFALLGGLILNLMPCVFPVLSIKAMSLMGKAGKDAAQARMQGLVYTLGVLVTFAAIAGALLALRATGEAIGWGFQLQDPAIVAALAIMMVLIGLNLSGFYEIGTSLMGAGDSLTRSGGLSGAFFTGVLAVIVATPCTAPFMGTALGLTLTQPAPVAIGIFLALGFGMALPFLILSFSPTLLQLLPKPGAWMETFRQAMAFPMYATAVWLVWVVSQQAGADGVLVALSGMVLAAFAIWVWKASAGAGAGWRVTAAALVLVSLGGIIAFFRMPLAAPSATVADAGAATTVPYEAYSPARLDTLLSEGKPVFVNLTAAWCITCKVNEQVALSSARIADAFAGAGITYLKGDWTNRDPEITRLLEAHQRSGVPLYLFYAPGSRTPAVLPQVLTEDIVLSAIGAGT